MSIVQRLCWGAGYKSGISSLAKRAYVNQYPWSAALIGPWAESLQGGIVLQEKWISVVEMRSGQEGLPEGTWQKQICRGGNVPGVLGQGVRKSPSHLAYVIFMH